MSINIKNLEPQALWNHFSDLNAVPRGSKKENQVIEFMLQFGKSLNLPTFKDETGNVIIRKAASKGMEDRTPVVLQSHLDMVHQKNSDTHFDFDTQGIEMFTEGDWVKAMGTTLGADNGIGVATIMAILSSDSIAHPAIDALFTIDEETGMTGALGLKGNLLSGQILLNLDTEDDTELTIGCAGGIDVTGSGLYSHVPVPANFSGYSIAVKGLTGGHSGMDIHLGRGNANKIMNRILKGAVSGLGAKVSSIDGGSLRNAIPRESVAILAIDPDKLNDLELYLNSISVTIKDEYVVTDPNLSIEFNRVNSPASMLNDEFALSLIHSVYSIPNGIYRMSPAIEGLVQTSNNLARIIVKEGGYSIQCLTRSSVDSEKMDLAEMICSSFSLLGAQAELKGSYPGWTPQPDSMIVKLMSDIYSELFDGIPHVNACHAGLECGILGTNYPDMQMISFGPNIRGAHSPDEKVQISSVQKYWKYLLTTLERIPTR